MFGKSTHIFAKPSRRLRSRIRNKWITEEINAWNASANVFPDFADVSRGPGKKDDRNREEERRGKGSETEGSWWRYRVARSSYRYGGAGDEGGGFARVDLQGSRGGQFFPFLSEGKSGPEPVMESRHVSAVHTLAEPAAFPVTRLHPSCFTLALKSREFLSFSPSLSFTRILFCSHECFPSRICTCKLTDRHWIPSYTNTPLRNLYKWTRSLRYLIEFPALVVLDHNRPCNPTGDRGKKIRWVGSTRQYYTYVSDTNISLSRLKTIQKCVQMRDRFDLLKNPRAKVKKYLS